MSVSSSSGGRPVPDHVIGIFARERLSEVLAATHRAGFGPYTRVLDGQRSNTAVQLSRASLEIVAGPVPEPEDLLVVVQAPGRVGRVMELFQQLGARVVVEAQRSASQSVPSDVPPAPLPGIVQLHEASIGDEAQ